MNYLKIIKEIKTNGYYICNNFYKKKDLNKIKNSLLNTLNYIKKANKKIYKKNTMK